MLFALAGLCEIGGGYLMEGDVRQGRPRVWTLAGVALLALYSVVATFQLVGAFGRICTWLTAASSPRSRWRGTFSRRASVPTFTMSGVSSSSFAVW